MSCIELLEKWGYKVDCESRLPIADVIRAGKEGKLEEVFGTGTAAVVSPVKELVWKGEHPSSATARSALLPRSCTTP